MANATAANCDASISGTALHRGTWVASTNSASKSTDEPAYALDGSYHTRFSTNETQAPGLFFEVDMGLVMTFDELVMQTPHSPTDFARGYEVQVSNNGAAWATVASCAGVKNPEVVTFGVQKARYLRVVLTKATPKYWWSIDELRLFLTPSSAPTTTTTTTTPLETTTVALSASANPVGVGSSVTYTAHVSPVPKGGVVKFFANGSPLLGCQDVAVNTSSGNATCTTSYSSLGSEGVQAFYAGSGPFRPSASGIYDQSVRAPAPGYWLATADGQVYGTGAAHSFGGLSTSAANNPVVGIASTPSAQGYWVATRDGSVKAFGDAKFYGDLPAMGLHVRDIMAIAPTTNGRGYYLVGADGGFFTFGNAKFHGSLPGIHVHAHDVVGMVATPSGAGYLLVGADGGVFSFGESRFYGSLPGLGKHVHDIKAILPSSTGRGYVLVGGDGGAFIFGTGVHFYGSLPGRHVKVANIVGIALTPDDGGYLMAGADGRVYGFGDAGVNGEPSGLSSNLPVAAIAGT
ncbi:MAG: discoidin domain-containing protein [Acidimicrobiales bacterium]